MRSSLEPHKPAALIRESDVPATWRRQRWTTVILLAVAWTAAIGLELFRSARQGAQMMLELAEWEARTTVQKDALYQRWLMTLGGVYARITDQVPPNPCLTDPAQAESSLTSGQRVTLVNPAYLNRQVQALGRHLGIGSSRLIGNEPRRPENTADAWELEALRRLAKGETEVSGVEIVEDREQMRFLRVTPVDGECRKCHSSETAGAGSRPMAMSLALDLAPFKQWSAAHDRQDFLGLVGLWLLGLGGLAGGQAVVARRARDRDVAAARLAAVEAELSDFYEHAPDMFLTVAAGTGEILACNERLEQLLGWSRGEVLGRRFGELCRPSCQADVARALERLQEFGEIRQLDLKLPAPDGGEVEVELNATAVLDEAGRRVRGRVVLRDITQRRIHEREIERLTRLSGTLTAVSQAILRATAPEPLLHDACAVTCREGRFEVTWIGRWDPASRRLSVVASALAESTATPDEWPGVPEGDDPGGLMAACISTGRAAVRDLFLRSGPASGDRGGPPRPTERRWCGAAVPVMVAGQPWGAFGVAVAAPAELQNKELAMLEEIARDVAARLEQFHQVTLREEADHALRESEAKLRTVVEHIPQKIFLKDCESRYLFINQHYARDLGIRPDEVVGRDDREFFSADLAGKYRSDDRRVLSTGEVENLEEQYLQDGQRVWIHITKCPIRDADGAIVGLCGIFQDITEQKLAQDALRAREAQLAAAQRVARIGSWQRDLVTGQVTWSDEVFRIYGVDPSGFRPSHARTLTFVHPDDRRRVARQIQEGVESGQVYDLEYRITRPDGVLRHLHVTGQLETDEAGRPLRTVGVTQDITERKAAEHALRRRGRILEAVGFAAERFLRESDWRRSLPAALQRLGEAAEVSRTVLFQRRRGDDGSDLVDHVEEWACSRLERRTGDPRLRNLPIFPRWVDAIEQGRVIRGRVRDLPDTERRMFEGHGIRSILVTPVHVSGRWWGFLAFDDCDQERAWVSDDVESIQASANLLGGTIEREAGEEALRRVTNANQLVLNAVGEGIMGLDLRGEHTFVNPAAARMLGYEIAEMLGRDSHALWHHARSDGQPYRLDDCPIHGAIHAGEHIRRIDEVFWRKDGTSFPVEYVCTPVVEDGRITGAVVTFADISARRQLEAQLWQAQKMEAIGQLAGGVAHDFNNILASILLNLSLVPTGPNLDAETRQTLRELESDAQRAANLTRQLLLFSRRSVMQVRPLDLNQVVEQLLKMLRRLIGEHISLDWSGAASLPAISGDAGMLEQVIMNLVVNARDAMPDGGRIRLGTEVVEFASNGSEADPQARPGRFVRFAVADTGCGMDESVRRRVFEPFFTTKPSGKGTGLGLATVYGIAQQHGGWVSVESSVGKGSVFRVFLPALDTVPTDAGPAPENQPIRGGTETILFVEDDTSMRRTLSQFLRQCGYRVIEAVNGVEALRQWDQVGEKVDLLFSDMVMPMGLNGLQLAERLRTQRPGLRVIISSGYSPDLVRQHDLAGQGIVFLPKPSLARDLAAAIRRCLDASPA